MTTVWLTALSTERDTAFGPQPDLMVQTAVAVQPPCGTTLETAPALRLDRSRAWCSCTCRSAKLLRTEVDHGQLHGRTQWHQRHRHE